MGGMKMTCLLKTAYSIKTHMKPLLLFSALIVATLLCAEATAEPLKTGYQHLGYHGQRPFSERLKKSPDKFTGWQKEYYLYWYRNDAESKAQAEKLRSCLDKEHLDKLSDTDFYSLPSWEQTYIVSNREWHEQLQFPREWQLVMRKDQIPDLDIQDVYKQKGPLGKWPEHHFLVVLPAVSKAPDKLPEGVDHFDKYIVLDLPNCRYVNLWIEAYDKDGNSLGRLLPEEYEWNSASHHQGILRVYHHLIKEGYYIPGLDYEGNPAENARIHGMEGKKSEEEKELERIEQELQEKYGGDVRNMNCFERERYYYLKRKVERQKRGIGF